MIWNVFFPFSVCGFILVATTQTLQFVMFCLFGLVGVCFRIRQDVFRKKKLKFKNYFILLYEVFLSKLMASLFFRKFCFCYPGDAFLEKIGWFWNVFGFLDLYWFPQHTHCNLHFLLDFFLVGVWWESVSKYARMFVLVWNFLIKN